MGWSLTIILWTVAAFKWFLVAMLLFPDVQKKAQDELDYVIGRDRLPTFEDRPRLPYVDAVCKEVLPSFLLVSLVFNDSSRHAKYRSIIASIPSSVAGVPQNATQNEFHESFFIPKG